MKMKTNYNFNTFIQWPSLFIINMKINLIKLHLISKKRNKKLKYAFHHNKRNISGVKSILNVPINLRHIPFSVAITFDEPIEVVVDAIDKLDLVEY
ncbi:unnamed protein product [Rotaria sp. Silwood1]|nr:unnamed protein product [Rotaria sp. Silwood1]CAF3726719.1 unnamed protein product [Rotaria sp. Silwood1]CAF4936585.1 unnamed protein product [Rotaria sp. Silwood1]